MIPDFYHPVWLLVWALIWLTFALMVFVPFLYWRQDRNRRRWGAASQPPKP